MPRMPAKQAVQTVAPRIAPPLAIPGERTAVRPSRVDAVERRFPAGTRSFLRPRNTAACRSPYAAAGGEAGAITPPSAARRAGARPGGSGRRGTIRGDSGDLRYVRTVPHA